jgi:hypothetical protein
MAKRGKRKARKWAPRSEGKRQAVIHCRVPERVYDALARAAERNKWTVSAEVVDRLAQSFALPTTSTQAIMALVAYAIDGMAQQNNPVFRNPSGATWLNDPYLHREARIAALTAFQLLEPKGYPPAEPEGHRQPEKGDVLARPSGRWMLEYWWSEVRHYDCKSPIDASRPRRAQHQRRLAMLREGLGKLPDKVVLWGKTVREARRQLQQHRRELLPLDEQHEFTVLARERVQHGLSPKDHQRFCELAARTPQRLALGDLSNPGPFPDLRLEPDRALDKKIKEKREK